MDKNHCGKCIHLKRSKNPRFQITAIGLLVIVSLLDKSNPKSIVGVVHTPNGSYDVEPNSIESVISEDEKIRKEIVDYLKKFIPHCDDDLVAKSKVWISWLEKQGEQKPEIKYIYPKFRVGDVIEPVKPNGCYTPVRVKYIGNGNYSCESDDCKSFLSFPICNENEYVLTEQKPADKVEPKFNVGDWITNNCEVWYIESIHNGLYNLKGTNGYGINNTKSKIIDNDFHFWTIQDAKDGDVLASNGNIILFKEISNSARKDYKYIQSHCLALAHSTDFYTGGSYNLDDRFHPATKEQHDLLFQKMKEAGYEWDAEKKELKKIEQNPVWSEDDEKMKSLIISTLTSMGTLTLERYHHMNLDEVKDWLKSLKPNQMKKRMKIMKIL